MGEIITKLTFPKIHLHENFNPRWRLHDMIVSSWNSKWTLSWDCFQTTISKVKNFMFISGGFLL